MIAESRFYKDDLLRFADAIESWIRANRWSDRRWYQFESGVVSSAMVIRRLAEAGTLSDDVAGQLLPVDRFKPTGKRITRINRHRINELYDLDSGRREALPLLRVANQLIHSYVLAYWPVIADAFG